MTVARKIWAISAFASAKLAALSVTAQNQPYLSDLPKIAPGVYAAWKQSLPVGLGSLPDWLTNFQGVVTPIRDVSVGGAPMKFSTTCKPHDCAANIAGVLFSAQGNRVAAVVRLATQGRWPGVLIIGQMNNAEFSCIQRLTDNENARSC